MRLIDAEYLIEHVCACMENDRLLKTATKDEILQMIEEVPSAELEIIRCKDCQWGREVCGIIECFVDSNIPSEYHGYEWFCPNGERRTDETD